MEVIPEGSSILLLGEGDFSFSVAYVHHLHESVKITSSSLLQREELVRLHKDSPDNIKKIEDKGVEVLYNLDATKLQEDERLLDRRFNRVIFNFPHVGGKSNIKKNRQLINTFFCSVVHILADGGDICVSFCQGQGGTPADQPIRAWHDSWQAVGFAAYRDLVLKEIWPFSTAKFLEYNSTGFRSLDKKFFTGGSSTYVFRRCLPITLPTGCVTLEPGCLDLNEEHYSISSSYVAEKFTRRLHSQQKHPISLVAQHVQETIQVKSNAPVTTLKEPNPVVRTEVSELTEDRPIYFPVLQIQSLNAEEIDWKIDKDIMSLSEVPDKIPTLRTSMLEHFRDIYECLDVGSIYCVSGNVCRRRPCVDCNDLPVVHETVWYLKSKGEANLDVMKALVVSVLAVVLGETSHVLVTKCRLGDIEDWLLCYCDKDQVYSIEVTCKSENLHFTQACNQVRETGKAEIPQDTPKCVETSKHLGYICVCKEWGKDCDRSIAAAAVVTLKLDTLAMTK